MGASRTLRRKLLADQARRADSRRVKPGTFNRRLTDVSDTWDLGDTHPKNGRHMVPSDIGKEATFHATKGLRLKTAPPQ